MKKGNSPRHRIIWAVLLLLFCASAAGVDKVTISFTGDIMVDGKMAGDNAGRLRSSERMKRYGSFFQVIKGEFGNSGLVAGNLEFPLRAPYRSSGYRFNCPPEIISVLKSTGFSLLNIANNHILDQGPEGLYSTIDILDSHGIEYVGAGRRGGKFIDGIIKNIRGMKIGVISYTGILNVQPRKKRDYYINWLYHRSRVNENINHFKARCDYLIMMVHSGGEYRKIPLEKDRKILHYYVNRGVDLVVRHHPHVLQPVERIDTIDGREGYIFYSLGNFISDKCKEQNSFFISGGEVYNASVILKLHLSREGRRINSDFCMVPVATVKRPGAGGGSFETVSLRGLMNTIRSKSRIRKNRDAAKDIYNLKNKVLEIKKTIYKYQYLEKVKIKG